MAPVIAVTPTPTTEAQPHGTFERYAATTTYVEAVIAGGGVPIVFPPQDGNIDRLLSTANGLILSGGADIAPALFGDQQTHDLTYGVHPLRDRFELDLITEAIRQDIPVLCICRGIQVLNVALGGTLHQHIPDAIENALPHRQHEVDLAPDAIGHEVQVVERSPLHEIFGVTTIGVNSFHHQSIRDIAPSLEVAAVAPDGVIESVYLPDRHFIVGVQWHPEMMFQRHTEHRRLFEALVTAASGVVVGA